MDEIAESWRVLTRLSPFLIPIAAAVVALLIWDLLEPHQWQRYVRKITASAFAGILVIASIAAGYILLLQHVSEDSLLVTIATFVVGLGTIPATGFAVFLVFRRVEPDLDLYMNSRFVFSFQNGSWPILSMRVSSECLPEGATSIDGRIAAVKEDIGQYSLLVHVGIGADVRTVLDGTTRDPQRGWMRVMQAVLKAQLGDLNEYVEWQDRIHLYGRFRDLLKNWNRPPTPTMAARHRWQNLAYLQVHRLAQRMDATGARRR